MLFQEFDAKCDVYSFGIVLWEIFTREEPFAEYQSFDKFKDAVCHRHERPVIPADCVSSLRDLMVACWDPVPSKRPAFSEIISKLDLVMVDCAIGDELGRRFWKDNFLKKEEVSWVELLDKFTEFTQISKRIISDDIRQLNIKCLHAVLAEKPKREGSGDIVNIEQFGKFLDWFGPLEIYNASNDNMSISGEIPLKVSAETNVNLSDTLVDKVRKLLMKTWFHGEINTNEAQLKLSGLPGGTFLVRFSSTHPGCYTISSLTQSGNASIKHQRVSYSAAERSFNLNGQFYKTLEDLIRESNNLFMPCPGSKFTQLFADQPHAVLGYMT